MDKPDAVRKTLAIVFCDIVAFTRLNATEGDLVAANVLRAFYEHAGRLAEEYHCSTIKFIGDRFLATLDSINDAMSLISSTQALLAQGEALSGYRLACAFSLNFGDVVYMETSYGTDVFGEQVNIAALLNDLARPHQLVVSQAAFDRLPLDLQARAGPSETQSLKRAGAVEFRRLDLTAS
jgi:class 3 adenylate cyclase